ncbi:TIGR02147 family protein [bacterium]|nr:TIGR02147 family protein [bacterium]
MLPFYRKALNDKLVERIRKNPKYSLRAFARAIEVDASILSKVLRGERYFSEELAIRVLDRIDLSYEEREWFLSSLARARVEAGLRRSSPAQKRRLAEPTRERSRELTRELTIDQFKIVADWYHYAILELTRVEGFRNDPAWIAGRLGLQEFEVIGAIDRLKLLELLEERDGTLINTSFYLNTALGEVSSAAKRRRQKQILEKSMHALENLPISIRNHSARTVAIDPEGRR